MHVPKSKLIARLMITASIALFGLHAHAQSDEAAAVQPETAVSNEPAPADAAADAAATASPDVSAEEQVEPAAKPVANSKGLDESSLSNEKGHDEFKRPLLFAPDDNGLQPENPQIKWEMDPDGKQINMGGLKLWSSQINVKLDQTKRAEAPNDLRSNSKGPSSVINFSFSWPTVLTTEGTISIESLDKKVTFTQDITEELRASWRRKLSRYKTSYLKSHQGNQWGMTDLPPKALHDFRSGTPFRVCISKQNSEIERLKVCSAPYAFQSVGPGRTQVGPVKSNESPTVFLRDKALGKTGLINTVTGKEVALRIVFAAGSMIEISSQPAALDLLDVVESKDGREIILTGRSTAPLGKKKYVEKPAMHFWAPTGVEQDTVWQVAIPKDAPTIRILGAFNLPFTFLFRFVKLPTENDRVFIREAATTGSYSANPKLFGYSSKIGRIESSEVWAKKTDDHHFEWDFAAPTVGARNKSRITLFGTEKEKTKWVAHHSLYRGYPFEASGRLSGVMSASGQIIILGEVAGSAWLETIGFENDFLSRQRWGFTARYFRALTPVQSATGISTTDFSAMNGDLKYNLVRGIWNRDQLFGLIGSLEHVQIAGLSANLAGAGAYWARTMPKVFSDLFDLFPLLDYSKYVDVEFVYYPLAASSGISTSKSFNLNFHGKVFWTSRLYGEAGFGFHQYDFSDTSQNKNSTLSTAYGNIGMGLIF
jgi:hypothetical protein